jgi:trehalose synthase
VDVASLTTERFATPTGARERRALDAARKRAVEALAGRTVWSAVALPDGRAGARMVRACLRWAGDSGVSAERLDVAAGDPLEAIARHLEALLTGAASGGEPGAAGRDAYDGGLGDGDGLVGRGVRPDDVVVLHDPLTAVLAQAVRDRGAHAVWEVRIVAGPREAGVEDAWSFLRPYTAAVDAYVVTGNEAGSEGVVVRQVAALMPGPGVLSTKLAEGGQGADDLAWGSVLADVVDGDRGETVGGTLRPRPAIARR